MYLNPAETGVLVITEGTLEKVLDVLVNKIKLEGETNNVGLTAATIELSNIQDKLSRFPQLLLSTQRAE